MKGSLDELRWLLDGMEIGFLTTLGAEGHFHSRPPGGTLHSLYTRLKNALVRPRAEPAPKKELELGHPH